VEVFAFVAELSKLRQHHATNQHIARAEGISQVRVGFEHSSEVLHHIESLEDRVDAVIPLNLSLILIAVSVE